jgi:iron(III) transport system ATP-binding protein
VNDPVLEVRSVRKSFGDVTAVDGIDLTITNNEIVALVGPSGCGKSTLLRLTAGLTTVDSGVILIDGHVVDDGVRRLEPEHRHTGIVFQEHALFPHLNVANNITFGLRDVPRRERTARSEHWLDVIGLHGHGDRYPHELSGGERQRVALARALAPGPRLVLLDEPFASLDPNLRARLRADIIEIVRTLRTPALFVTHDQIEALTVGDRVAVMRAGRFEQLGTPDAVYHQPNSRFVASFMGDAAFLVVQHEQTELGRLGHPAPDGALLVVRPHDINVEIDPSASGATATVVRAEFQGPTWTYTLRLPSGTLLRTTQPHTTRLALGDEIRTSLRPGQRPIVAADIQ